MNKKFWLAVAAYLVAAKYRMTLVVDLFELETAYGACSLLLCRR
jgi:hypothetical protein